MGNYEPGICNINREESRKRYLTGGLGIGLGLIFSLSYVALSSPAYMIIFVFISYTTGVLGILQGSENFCVKHARRGTQKTGDEKKQIQDEKKLERDESKANKMMVKSVSLGLLAALSVHLARIYVF